MVISEKQHPLLVYLEDYWLLGGLAVVNAIGTQLRDLMELEAAPIVVGGVINNGHRHRNQEESRE